MDHVVSASAPTSSSRLGHARTLPRLAATLAAGALFGFGLALSTMIRPDVILGFLRFQDAGLILVLSAAAVVTFVAYRYAPLLMRRPLLGGSFGAHDATLESSTVVGAAIFGVGWGLSGVCPGPAIAGLGAGSFELAFAVAGIAIGALIQGLTARRST